jgi:dihydroflavonol-4-reductase
MQFGEKHRVNRISGERVLITGASGFIGSAAVRAFLNAGFTVRAFVRPSSPRTNLKGLPIEIAEGDITNRLSIAAALKNVQFLVHAAADYRLWARDPSEIFTVNVTGTKTVLEAALNSGVEKIVYTSSVCTLAKPPHEPAADETLSLAPEHAFNAYKKSKTLAEQGVRDLISTAGLPAVIVNPSAPIGPRDVKPTPTGRIILESAAGRMPAYVDTGLNLVHVDDVAAGYVSALKSGVIGERYILGGQNIRLKDMLTEIARQTGGRPPRVRLPVPVVYPFALASEGFAWIAGTTPFATRDGLKMARDFMYFKDTKARKELDYHSRPYEEGVSDAIAWFRSEGMLPQKTVSFSRRFNALRQ